MAFAFTNRCAVTVLAATVTLGAFPDADAPVNVGPRPRAMVEVQDQQPAYASDRVIVKYRSRTAAAEGARLHALVGATAIKHLHLIDADVVRVPAGWSVEETVQWYAEQDAVAYVEPDYLYFAIEGLSPATTPTDPRFAEQWALNNTGQTGGTADADIDAPEAWDITTGNSALVVAVIDEGIDVGHPDLAANIWVNEDEIPDNEIDDDGNGYVDDINGWDFFNDDNSVYDGTGNDTHGTHVAGTIGAVGSNAEGVAGIAWQVKLMSLKFLGPEGGSSSDAITALEYAVDNGATLTSNSWGGGSFSQALQDAIEASGDAGMLFIAAAGNGGTDGIGDDNDITPHYPSSYPLDNIVAVASTDDDDARAGSSNYGLTSVDLGAPGVSILSTWPTGEAVQYNSISGTSMATPHVAGVAVLIHSAYPALSHLEVKSRLLLCGDPVASLAGITVSGRRLNAYNALEDDQIAPNAVVDLAIVPDAEGLVTPLARTSLTLEWTAPGDDGAIGTAAGYDLRYATAPIDDATFDAAFQATGVPDPAIAGTTESYTVPGLNPATQYYFALKTFDNVGNLSGLSNSASGNTDDVTMIFADDAETGASDALWIADAPWARTTEDASPDGAQAPLSGSYSWTDSPGGDYSDGVTTNLTSIAFSLEDATNSAFEFDHRYDIEDTWDHGYVQVSANGGASWTTLGSYTGTQDAWTSVSFDLSAYDGEPSVQVRFQLTTDIVITRDGWYIDDVRVFADAIASLTIVSTLTESGDSAIVAMELENDIPIAGVDYELQWEDASGLLTYDQSNLTDRTTGFTHDMVYDAGAHLLSGILVDPGGAAIDSGRGAIIEHRMEVTLPPSLVDVPLTSVEVEAPADPREGLPRIFFQVPFELVDLSLSDTLGNPVLAQGNGGSVDIDLLNADVDFSGDVTVSDVVTTIDYFLDQVTLTDLQFLVADAYLDTVINVVDVVRGINIILGRQIGISSVPAMLAAEDASGEGIARGVFNVAYQTAEGIDGAQDRNVAALVADVPSGVVGLQIRIQYDPSNVKISSAKSLIEQDGFRMAHRIGSNSAEFILYSAANTPLRTGHLPVIELELDAKGANSTESSAGSIQVVEFLGVDAAGMPVYPSLDPMLAIEGLLGISHLTAAQKQQLDREGNRDGTYDVGDLLALLHRSGLLEHLDMLAKPDTSGTPKQEPKR
jgi:subtilisin family serine protease